MENPKADRALASGFGLVVGLGTSVHGVARALDRLNVGDHDAASGSVLVAFAGASFAAWTLRWWSEARLLQRMWVGAWFVFLAFLLTKASSKEVFPILFVGVIGVLLLVFLGKRIAAASQSGPEPAQPDPATPPPSPVPAARGTAGTTRKSKTAKRPSPPA